MIISEIRYFNEPYERIRSILSFSRLFSQIKWDISTEYCKLWEHKFKLFKTVPTSTEMVDLFEYRDRKIMYFDNMFEYYQNTHQVYYELFLDLFDVMLDEFLRIREENMEKKIVPHRELLICMQKKVIEATKEYKEMIQMIICTVCRESGKQTHCETCFAVTCEKCTKLMHFCPNCRAEPKVKSWAAHDPVFLWGS